MLQTIVHYTLHFLVPLGISSVFFRSKWKYVYLVFLASMLVDLDHLLASPIFDAQRCSINFHPLHSYIAIVAYLLLLLFPKTRIIAFALLFHMATDALDCCWLE
jgi:hypothetical protein